MKIDQQTLSVLSGVEYVPGFPRRVRIVEKLDRGDYTRVNKVLEALGGKWSKKVQAHEFGSDARPRIEHALTIGEVETGQDVGHFPTPAPLARRLVVDVAGVREGHHVLEPSAGSGNIVRAIIDAGGIPYAVERDYERRRALTEIAGVCGGDDFMDFDPDTARFDRVTMNPPFCVVGRGDHLDHVRHAHGMLVEGGVLAAILPTSIKFRRDRRYKEFRQWGEGLGWEVIDLPEGSFKESGTGVNTVIIRVRQSAIGES